MSTLQFRSLSGSELIEVADGQFELSIETPDGRRDIKLANLMAFVNAALEGRVGTLEETLEALGLDPGNPRTITVDGDVEGTASLMDNNVVLTLNVPDGALSTSKVANLAATLLGLQLDVDDVIAGLATKLNADAPAISAHKLTTARRINDVLFDGTQDITVGLTPEQQEQLGTDKHYVHEQTETSNLWYVNHFMNKYPSVIVLDSAGTEVVGGIEYVDANSLRVNFAGAMAGKAYLN